MSTGVIGTKLGMTRVFTEKGVSIPVTIVEVQPNYISQIKSEDKDGYSAIQITTGDVADRKINSPERGHFAKSGVKPGRGLWEFRVASEDTAGVSVGDEVNVTRFSEGDKVDVRGITLGKGFTGVMKRWGFGGGRATHGNSKAHRKPGSIGQNQTPSRVFPGKKMAGHSGSANRIQQNLEVTRVDKQRSLLFIKGAIPGARQSDVIVTQAVKAKKQKSE